MEVSNPRADSIRQQEETIIKFYPFQTNEIYVHMNYLELNGKSILMGIGVECPNFLEPDMAEKLADTLRHASEVGRKHNAEIARKDQEEWQSRMKADDRRYAALAARP